VFFEHAQFGFLGGRPRIKSQSRYVRNTLVAGKNAGNFADSAALCENPSQKYL
jgi:hypothetical protein